MNYCFITARIMSKALNNSVHCVGSFSTWIERPPIDDAYFGICRMSATWLRRAARVVFSPFVKLSKLNCEVKEDEEDMSRIILEGRALQDRISDASSIWVFIVLVDWLICKTGCANSFPVEVAIASIDERNGVIYLWGLDADLRVKTVDGRESRVVYSGNTVVLYHQILEYNCWCINKYTRLKNIKKKLTSNPTGIGTPEASSAEQGIAHEIKSPIYKGAQTSWSLVAHGRANWEFTMATKDLAWRKPSFSWFFSDWFWDTCAHPIRYSDGLIS